MAETATKVPVKTAAKKQETVPAATAREWRPFETLRNEIDHLFEDFDKSFWHTPLTRSLFDVEPFWRREFKFTAVPAADIVEHEQAYEVTVETPGMDDKNIQVELSEGMLVISGEKKEEKEETKKNYHLSERHHGSFQRSFRIPENVLTDQIGAAFKNGVLTVTLPKNGKGAASAKKVEIKAG